MDAGCGIDRITVKGDLPLQQTDFGYRHPPRMSACFEKRMQAILAFIICASLLQSVNESKKDMNAPILVQPVADAPIEHYLVPDVLVDFGIVPVELCIEIEETILQQIAVPDMSELLVRLRATRPTRPATG